MRKIHNPAKNAGKQDTLIKKNELVPEVVKRVETGIDGFDLLIEGGIPDKSVVLLAGPTGTGKSLFGMKFLVHGASKGENGVYVSIQENMKETIHEMNFFWPVEELMKQKKILITQPDLYNFDSLLATIEDSIDNVNAKRLVIDSISIIDMYFEEPFKIRKAVLTLANLLKKLDCTSIIISQVTKGMSLYGVEEFVADGVIQMYYLKSYTSFFRALSIKKMRTTNHSMSMHPVKIVQPGGIIVYPDKLKFPSEGEV